MFSLLENPVLQGGLIFAAFYYFARFLYYRDNKVENRRRGAITAAEKLRAGGQNWVADFVTDYAVGDYDGVGARVVKMIELAKHDESMKTELKLMALNAVRAYLGDKEVVSELVAQAQKLGTLPKAVKPE